MNIKKKSKLFCVILFVFSACFVLYNLQKPNIKSFDEMSVYDKIQKQMNNYHLENFLVVNEKRDTLRIKDLVINNKLILRFSELHCDACVIKEFENLKSAIDNKIFKLDDIIILTYYQNPRYLNLFKRLNKLHEFEVYNLIENKIGNFKLDEMSIPFFFILDQNLMVKKTFIPLRTNDSRTNKYLKKIAPDLRMS
ncbi:hypothetical protein [Hyunsoonleella ulvae]|uniref:hypothetical protein n=1 Tax=Hyunsoonleella ulvae TaxID=2799948 RepID=UPI00193AB7CD|nr:hypothetical protein [Hyunsoonleella ulvae]